MIPDEHDFSEKLKLMRMYIPQLDGQYIQIKSLLESYPDDPYLLSELAALEVQMGCYAAANDATIKMIEALGKRNISYDPLIFLRIAKDYCKANLYEAALEYVDCFLRKEPHHESAMKLKANIQISIFENKQARAMIDEWLQNEE